MMEFSQVVHTLDALRAVLPPPQRRALAKVLPALDIQCRRIIEHAPLVVIASGTAAGELDVSPRGDPAGFVQVLDEHTLAIPDRPGNRRADTFRNVLENPGVALLFVVPGRAETLRVNGRALLVRDGWLLQRMAVQGKAPELALVVQVVEAFVHCGKCMLRSQLWEQASWPRLDALPSHARCLAEHAGGQSLEQMEAELAEGYRQRLY